MKGRERFLKIVFFLLMIVPATWSGAAFGATLEVPSATYPTIQDAINAPNAPGEVNTVLVADGTYYGPDNVNLVVDKPVKIQSKNGPNLTIIDCQGNGRAFTFKSGATTETLLKGFTITGGNVVGSGGGILCDGGASPTIEDCIITANGAQASMDYSVLGYGGGIACTNSSPLISNCHIEGNSAAIGGGGFYFGGSSPTVTGCTITRNTGGYFGGGVYMESMSSPSFSSCMVTQNSATIKGGGFYCFTSSSPSLINCTVADNSTSNVEQTAGGGMYLYFGCLATVTNSIFWNNRAVEGPEVNAYFNCTLNVSFSNIKGGENSIAIDAPVSTTISALASTTTSTPTSTLEWSDTNKTDDPKFVAPDAGDYHLASDSPCVDAGTPDVDLPDVDFEGDPRVLNATPDKGGDEYKSLIKEYYKVQINVRPGSRHNKIDLGAWGFLPVAVLSTENFDATSINPDTVEFAGSKPLHSVRAHVNRDRKADMLFFFWIRDLDFGLAENITETPTTIEVTLTGESTKEGSIIGTDTVTIINPKHKKHWWPKFEQMSQKKGHCNPK